jgi:mannosyltransferase
MTPLAVANGSVILSSADAVDRGFERQFWRWSVLFIMLLFAALIVRDIRTKLWTDEFFTLFMAREAGAEAIVNASLDGLDSAPPLYPIIVHFLLPIVRHDALAARLPATAGYCVMLVCLLAVSRRRLGASYAWTPPLLAFAVCDYYGSEGRPYGLVLGCAAAALLCWQAATDDRRRTVAAPLLALSLALATALHYYSIFLSIPLMLGEIARQWKSRRFAPGLLLALGSGPIVLAAHYPIIAVTRHTTAFFWSQPSWSLVTAFYNEYVRTILYVCGGFALIALALFPPARAAAAPRSRGVPAHELIAAAAMVLMPPVAMVVSAYTTHAFVDRYVLWANIGAALLGGALLRIAAGGQPVVGILISALLVAQVAGHQVREMSGPATLRRGESLNQALRAVPDTAEPIVISDVHAFMELAFYGEPRWKDRLVYALSRDLEMRYNGSDTRTRMMSAARSHTSLRVADYAAILSENLRFVLAARPDDYLLRHLLGEGFRISALPSPVGLLLFEVSRPG